MAREKQAHIDCVMADRQVGVRGNHISEIDASRANGDGMGQMVKIAIDGMDQAKFKVPRNLKSSAEFSSLWRPSLHVVGCLAFGHVEAYYIMNSDQKKDANMEATVVSKVLDLINDKLVDSGHVMPRTLVVGADNTVREAKTNILSPTLLT